MPMLLQVLLAFVIIACATRLTSGRRFNLVLASRDSLQTPTTLPYWLPYFGHYFELCRDWRTFLGRAWSVPKDTYHGALSLYVLGRKCSVIYHHRLARTIFQEHADHLDSEAIRWQLLISVFGAIGSNQQAYQKVEKQAQATLNECLVSDLMAKACAEIRTNAPELVSFSESIVDQNSWERLAEALVAQQPHRMRLPAVEVSFFALIKNIVGQALLTALFGKEFVELFPSALEDLSALDNGWGYLALGLPRWLPVRHVSQALGARTRLLDAISSFLKALDAHTTDEDPGRPWRDLSDVSALMKERHAFCRQEGFPAEIERPALLALVWGLHTKLVSLVSWTMLRIWATPGVVDRIRDEIQHLVTTPQRRIMFGIAEPTRLSIDSDGLVNCCPLLKASLYECARLYCSPISVGLVKKSFTVPLAKTTCDSGEHSKSIHIEAGDYIAFAAFLTKRDDPASLDNEEDFKPETWLTRRSGSEGDGLGEALLKDSGNDLFNVPWSIDTEKEILAIIAGMVSLWDVSAPSGKESVVPKRSFSSAFAQPVSDIRVLVSSREFPSMR
ncbi:MAG: hypothetical protein Q9163_001965 [Psora crenata]